MKEGRNLNGLIVQIAYDLGHVYRVIRNP